MGLNISLNRYNAASIRFISSYLSAILSAVTLISGFALWIIPTLPPVGTVAALILSTITLSLPVWAMGIFYSLYVGSLNATLRVEQVISTSLACSIGLFFIGFVVVLLGAGIIRTIGDLIYLVAIVLLFVSSVTVLLVEKIPLFLEQGLQKR